MSGACDTFLERLVPIQRRITLGSASGGGLGGGLPSLQAIHSKILAEHPKSADGSKIGVDGPNRSQYIYSSKPKEAAKKLFEKFAQGRKALTLKNGAGYVVHFANGDRVNYRPTSSSDGSPVIDVHIGSQGKLYKIHFLETK